MHLKDVMKREVDTVSPDTPLREAAHKLNARGVPVLPVCEGATMVGVLTARDITVRATAQGRDPRVTRVREVMTAPAIYGREDQDLDEAADLMERWRLRRLPVLDQQMHLVGMVSLPDLWENFVAARAAARGHGTHQQKRILGGWRSTR